MPSIVEHAVVIGLGAAIVTAVVTTDITDQLHDGVREAVCLVRGPDCDSETWTEHDRPESPEDPAEFEFGVFDFGDIEDADVRAAVEFALAQQGKPYLWGGNGPNAFDCSGLVQQAYLAAGVQIPRVTTSIHAALPQVPAGAMIPGDLVFFNMGSGRPVPDHMGMYIGGGNMMHCGNPCRVVDLGSSYWQSRFYAANRVVPA